MTSTASVRTKQPLIDILPLSCLLFVLMLELSWVVAWYVTLNRANPAATTLNVTLSLGGMLLIAASITWFMTRFYLLPALRRGLVVVFFILSLLFVAPKLLDTHEINYLGRLTNLETGLLTLVITSVWIWWRGFHIAGQSINPNMVWNSFRLGLAGLVFLGIYHKMQGIRWEGIGVISAFLFLGLVAMILFRISSGIALYGVGTKRLGRRWWGIILLAVAAFVGGAFLIAYLLTGPMVFLLDGATQALRWFLVPLMFVLSIIAYVGYYLGLAVYSILALILPESVQYGPQQLIYPPSEFNFGAEETTSPTLPPLIQFGVDHLPDIILWLAAFVIIAGLARLAQRRLSMRSRIDFEEAEGINSKDKRKGSRGLGDQARSLIKSISRLFPGQRFLTKIRIRQIYAAVLSLAENFGQPRKTFQTPLEYLPVIQGLFPGASEEAKQITRAYLIVRYGENPEDPDTLEIVETAWRRIQAEANQLLDKKKSG